MQYRPQPWTHHHVHRLYHLSMGICFSFVVLALIGGMTFGMRASATDIVVSHDLHVSATVEGINPGPIEPPPSNGGSKPPVATVNPTVTIVAEPQGHVPTRPLGNNTAYVFNDPRPIFSGTTSVPNGIVFLYIQGPVQLNSTAPANTAGQWLWQSPDNLPPGNYLITAVVYDSYDLTRYGTTHAYFIVGAKGSNPGSGGTGPGSNGSGGSEGPPIVEPIQPGKVFGLFFQILDQYKVVETGGELKAWVTLVSNNAKQITNQEVDYSVTSPTGRTILETKDMISFSKESQYLKTFNIAPNTPPGKYIIRAVSTYNGIQSVASDTFYLKQAPFVASVAPQGPAIIWSLMLLLLLLFLLLVYITYVYVRHHTRELNNENVRQPL
jgi:hypothetical protein